jgi:hypothetical protein
LPNPRLTLQVNDLGQSIAKLKSGGVRFAEAEPRKEAVGNAIFILDPFGRRISLMHQTIVKAPTFKEPRIYNFPTPRIKLHNYKQVTIGDRRIDSVAATRPGSKSVSICYR